MRYAGFLLAFVSLIYPHVRHRITKWSTVASYSIMIVILASATTLVDDAVWFRDMSASPSPFPLALVLHKLRLSPDDKTHHCLTGCTCSEKLPPSSPVPTTALPTLGPWGSMSRMASELQLPSGQSIPVMIPTAAESQTHIRVGFDV